MSDVTNELKEALANFRNYYVEKESVQTSEPPSIEDSERRMILSDLEFAKQVFAYSCMTFVGNSEVDEVVVNVPTVTMDEDDSSAIDEQKV